MFMNNLLRLALGREDATSRIELDKVLSDETQRQALVAAIRSMESDLLSLKRLVTAIDRQNRECI